MIIILEINLALSHRESSDSSATEKSPSTGKFKKTVLNQSKTKLFLESLTVCKAIHKHQDWFWPSLC